MPSGWAEPQSARWVPRSSVNPERFGLDAAFPALFMALLPGFVRGAATFALKALGPVLLGGRERSLPPPVVAAISLLAPAVLAALVATQVFGGERQLVVDARAVGIAAAAVALLARLPLLLVVVSAAAATAVTRLVA